MAQDASSLEEQKRRLLLQLAEIEGEEISPKRQKITCPFVQTPAPPVEPHTSGNVSTPEKPEKTTDNPTATGDCSDTTNANSAISMDTKSEPIESVPSSSNGKGSEKGEYSDSDSELSDVDDLLEGPVDANRPEGSTPQQPEQKEKVVLKHRSTEYFEVLPEGWIEITHKSGMPVYLHKASRVCAFSRPYFLGPGSVRNHEIPLAAVPCLHQRVVAEMEEKRAADDAGEESEELRRLGAPRVHVQTADDFKRRNLDALQIREYCSTRFQFETVKILRFKSWSANRNFSRRRRLAREQGRLGQQLGRPSLPSHVQLITVPSMDHHSKPQHKPFFINPQGKTSIAVLHEYVQKVLKGNVQYDFSETRNAASPYAATVKLSAGHKAKDAMTQILARLPAGEARPAPGDQWVPMGRGLGNSKKSAKLEAAAKALHILMPGTLHFDKEGLGKESGGTDDSVALFDLIALSDARVVEMSAKAGQPAPFVILQECLKRHSAFGDTGVKTEMTRTGHQQHLFSMEVGSHSVQVPCSNKKEGKQKASQAMLAKLHPDLSNWGALIRLYGYAAHRRLQETKREKDSIIRLQKAGSGTSEPNAAILAKLRSEMRKMAGVQAPKALPRPAISL